MTGADLALIEAEHQRVASPPCEKSGTMREIRHANACTNHGGGIVLKLVVLLSAAIVAAAAVASPAAAGAPLHESFSGPVTFPNPCSFPVVSNLVFTNDVTTFFDDQGSVTALQLHQTLVGTLTANGTTLRANTQEQIFVDFTTSTVKEVGVLDSLFGPHGPVFFRTGFDLSDLSGATIARHGVLDFFDPVAYCAAFS
jgi:hypothetical protein